jgi:formylmethanofuran:tetrahydromethanopterin formyltransferase
MGEGPITSGRIFAAACAQLEASVAEQAAAEDWPGCEGLRESFAGGNCAEAQSKVMAQRSKDVKRVTIRRIGLVSANEWRWIGVGEKYLPRHAVHPGAE